MRLLILCAVVLGLAACGEAEVPAPKAEAPKAPAPAERPQLQSRPAAQPVSDADLERTCRDVVSRIYGQEGAAVNYRVTAPDRAEVSWRAPVDGGVLELECRAAQNRVGLFREGKAVSSGTQMAGG